MRFKISFDTAPYGKDSADRRDIQTELMQMFESVQAQAAGKDSGELDRRDRGDGMLIVMCGVESTLARYTDHLVKKLREAGRGAGYLIMTSWEGIRLPRVPWPVEDVETRRRRERWAKAVSDALSTPPSTTWCAPSEELCLHDGHHRVAWRDRWPSHQVEGLHTLDTWSVASRRPTDAPELSKEREDQAVALVMARAAELRARRLSTTRPTATLVPTSACTNPPASTSLATRSLSEPARGTARSAVRQRLPWLAGLLRWTSRATPAATRPTASTAVTAPGSAVWQRPGRPLGQRRPWPWYVSRRTASPSGPGLRAGRWRRPPGLPRRHRGSLPATLAAALHAVRQRLHQRH